MPAAATEHLPFLDSRLPIAERAADLVSRLTLDEKLAQLLFNAPAIERLGIPAYNWWNECLHGVARAGTATVFPQAIGLAASWNTDLIHRVGSVISDEARAKHHEAARQGDRGIYKGLTCWSPNINIFRDPRWGRGQETYGEDPYLTARLAVAFVRALQGDHPRYLKVVATPKHFAVHSGPEFHRHHFDARVSERDLRETYLPAFEACVREGSAASIMGAYNRTNGEPCCASNTLLQKILRDEWGFQGYVVSDCWAIRDIHKYHRVVDTPEEAAALAVRAGCDLNCGDTYLALPAAVAQGLLSEAEVDRAAHRLFSARLRLGLLDPPEQVPFAQIPIEVNDSEAHRALALQAARESMVLLKNEGDFLPLDKDLGTVAVIGPNAADARLLWANYNGTPSFTVTPLDGIRAAVSPETRVLYTTGCSVLEELPGGLEAAVSAAEQADVVVFVAGISQQVEGEEGQSEGVPGGGRTRGDRTDLDLPAAQEALLRAVHAAGRPVVLVLINGSALAVHWAAEHLPGILEAWYPGQSGGTAIAEVLFGDYNPAGRLPITFYRSADDLPPFDDYAMAGRTYRYFPGEVLYPFGFGLSYTRFAYRELRLSPARVRAGESVRVQVTVENVGERAGDEVVQLYVSDLEASVPVPIRQLQGFRRLQLQPGERQNVAFDLGPRQLSLIDDGGQRMIEPGFFQIAVGGRQPASDDPSVLVATLEVQGPPYVFSAP